MSKTRKKRDATAEWSKVVASWRASGETSKVFATRHGLNAGTLLWWSSRLSKRGQHSKRPTGTKAAAKTPAFTQVRVTSGSMAREGGRMEVVTRTGRVIRWEGVADADALRMAVRVVESC